MTVSDVVQALGLRVVAGHKALDRLVCGGYCGDLLSDVMARAKPKDIWITIQGHQNIVAVAVLTEVSAVIVCGNVQPEKDTLERADREGVPILLTPKNAFEVASKLAALL